MPEAFICDYVRTPFGRYGGALSSIRADDLAALPIRALLERNPGLEPNLIDDVSFGCANQAGEDNRNVARMAALLAGLPIDATGATVNRLCGSGMDSILTAARAIKAGEADLMIAGGVESMSRAPMVVAKASSAFSRNAEMYDTTIGWRFPNPELERLHGVDPMPRTAENVAERFNVNREDQDAFAARSQAQAAKGKARVAEELISVSIPQRKRDPIVVTEDEHPRPGTTVDILAKLRPIFQNGSVTAGNASGVNDGSAAMIVASEAAIKRHGLTPLARVIGGAYAGVEPRIMGMGPAPATEKLCARFDLSINALGVIELNEAFASQGIAVLRQLGIAEDDPRVNPNGGAIAIGHPLGASGTRITGTAIMEMNRLGEKLSLATMCIGVGQGIAIAMAAV